MFLPSSPGFRSCSLTAWPDYYLFQILDSLLPAPSDLFAVRTDILVLIPDCLFDLWLRLSAVVLLVSILLLVFTLLVGWSCVLLIYFWNNAEHPSFSISNVIDSPALAQMLFEYYRFVTSVTASNSIGLFKNSTMLLRWHTQQNVLPRLFTLTTTDDMSGSRDHYWWCNGRGRFNHSPLRLSFKGQDNLSKTRGRGRGRQKGWNGIGPKC